MLALLEPFVPDGYHVVWGFFSSELSFSIKNGNWIVAGLTQTLGIAFYVCRT